MKSFAVALICFLFSPLLHAEEIRVIDARRNIPLADDEPVFKDYYLNAGEGSGLKKNLVVNVVRKVTVRDASGAQTIGDMTVPVAQIKVIAVYGKVSVARDYKPISRVDQPMLEQTGIMGGDLVELKGSFVDNKKPESNVVSAPKVEAPREAASVAPATPAAVPEVKPSEHPAVPPMTQLTPSPILPVMAQAAVLESPKFPAPETKAPEAASPLVSAAAPVVAPAVPEEKHAE